MIAERLSLFLFGRRLTLIAIISSSELVAPRIARVIGNSPYHVVNTIGMRHLVPWQGLKKWLDVSEMQHVILLIKRLIRVHAKF